MQLLQYPVLWYLGDFEDSIMTGSLAGCPQGGSKRQGGLAAKMGTSVTAAPAAGAAFPGLARKFAETLSGEPYAEALPGELVYDSYAGPFLQALLEACADDECAACSPPQKAQR